jgi:hypothetical protein
VRRGRDGARVACPRHVGAHAVDGEQDHVAWGARARAGPARRPARGGGRARAQGGGLGARVALGRRGRLRARRDEGESGERSEGQRGRRRAAHGEASHVALASTARGASRARVERSRGLCHCVRRGALPPEATASRPRSIREIALHARPFPWRNGSCFVTMSRWGLRRAAWLGPLAVAASIGGCGDAREPAFDAPKVAHPEARSRAPEVEPGSEARRTGGAALDLGDVTLGTDVAFVLPEGTLGFHVVVEGEPAQEVGIERITSPSGKVVLEQFAPSRASSTTALSGHGPVATAQVPQSDALAARGPEPGPWTVRFGAPDGVGRGTHARAHVRFQRTGDGAFPRGRARSARARPSGARDGEPRDAAHAGRRLCGARRGHGRASRRVLRRARPSTSRSTAATSTSCPPTAPS